MRWLRIGREWPLAAALLVVCVGLCAPALRGAFYFNDIENLNLPQRSFFADGWRQNEVRWWASEAGGGFPLFAEGQAGPAYWPNALFVVVRPAWRAFTWSVILHLWWAALGVAALVRLLGGRRAAAFAAGVIYALSGPVWFRMVHLNFFHGLAWLPWVAVGLERGLRRQPLGFGLAGLAVAMQILAGHVHPPLLSGLLAPLYWLGRGPQVHRVERGGTWQVPLALGGLLVLLAAAARVPAARWLLLPGLAGGGWSLRAVLSTPQRRAWAASGVGVAAALGFAGLLAAVQLLPLLELVPHGSREAGVSAAQAQDPELTLTWPRLATFFLPGLHGSTYQEDVGEKIRWDLATEWEHSAHVGILTVLLLGLCPWLGRRPERWVFWGLAVIALLLAMGSAWPFYGWLRWLPGWSGVRGPSRLLPLLAWGAAMVAGLTLDDLARHGLPDGARRRWLNRVLFPVALLGLLLAATMIVTVAGQAPFRPEHAAAYTRSWMRFAILLVGGVVLLARRGSAPAPRWLWAAGAWVVLDLFSGSFGYHHVVPANYYARPAVADEVTADPTARIEVGLWRPHPLRTLRYLLYPPVSDASLYSPLAPRRQQRVERLLADEPNTPLARRWQSLLRIAWHWVQPPGTPGELVPTTTRDGDPLPRFPEVWTTPLWRQARSGEEAWALCAEPSWQPQSWAIVESPLAPAPRQGEIGEVLWSELGRHRLTCRVSGRSPQMLVVGQCGFPGWQVHREGAWTPALAVDYLLFGTKVPAGVHRVDFVFRPLSIRLGLFLSLCATAIVASGSLRPRGPASPQP